MGASMGTWQNIVGHCVRLPCLLRHYGRDGDPPGSTGLRSAPPEAIEGVARRLPDTTVHTASLKEEVVMGTGNAWEHQEDGSVRGTGTCTKAWHQAMCVQLTQHHSRRSTQRPSAPCRLREGAYCHGVGGRCRQCPRSQAKGARLSMLHSSM